MPHKTTAQRSAYFRRYYKKHRKRLLDYQRKYHVTHREHRRTYSRKWRLGAKYGLTVEAFQKLLEEQGHRCPICERRFQKGGGAAPHVDHDHDAGHVRGILCFRCNAALGVYEGWGVKYQQQITTYLKQGDS